MSVVDQAGSVREGEELDKKAIEHYVRQQIPDIEGTCQIRQYPGGASNLTYQISFADRDFILRRPPFGTKAKSAHDMKREYKVMSKLKPVYPYVPEMVAFCDDQDILGCEFYLMEKLTGIIPRADLPKGLNLSEEQIHQMCTHAIDRLIELHQVDYETAGLADLGKGQGYVKRQIEGWSKRYRNAMTDNVPDYKIIMGWLEHNMPEQVGVCIVHNDYRFDNLVFSEQNPTQIIGVLDWEMATLGDPLMELGNTLSYWVQADDDPLTQMLRRQPTHLPGMMTREEVFRYYCKKMGFDRAPSTYYRIYGLFRLAVILQQIYYRYHHGQTKDQRFANFHMMVSHLEKLCMQILETEG